MVFLVTGSLAVVVSRILHLCFEPHRTSASEARHMPHPLKTTLLKKKLQANAFNFFFPPCIEL